MKPLYKEKYPHLFSPMHVGPRKVEFKHRILLSPMGAAGLAFDPMGLISDTCVEHYTTYARGGFACVSIPLEVPPRSGHSAAFDLSEESNGFIAMHNLQRSVHTFKTKTLCEVYHAGFCMLPKPGKTLLGPSAFMYNGHPVKGMDEADMDMVAGMYEDAAIQAKRAGFDGLCLHYAHGWLMSQFLSPLTNHRQDMYGGSVENRVRFPRMVIERIRRVIGHDLFIEVRLNCHDDARGGITPDDAAQQALLLEDLIDMVHVSCGTRIDAAGRTKMHPTAFVPDAHNVPGSAALKAAGVNIPVGVVGSVHDPVLAERILAEGKADYILMARQGVADPDFVNKLREGREEDIRPCIRCDYCVDGGRRSALGSEVGMRADSTFDSYCSVNPLFRQGLYKVHAPRRQSTPKHVAVIGGGIAGMEAAATAAERGHTVVLFEQSPQLGGQTVYADHMTFKHLIKNFRNYLITRLRKQGVITLLETRATPHIIAQGNFDAAIVAIGGTPAIPPIPGVEQPHVLPVWNVFGNEHALGQQLLLIGGGSVGCETAIHLAGRGHQVTVLELLPHLAATAEISERMSILEELEKAKIKTLVETRCLRITPTGVEVRDKAGVTAQLKADNILLCTGTRPLFEEREAFRDVANDVIMIGDCETAGTIRTAVDAGYSAAISL